MKYLHFSMVTYFKRFCAFLSILRGVQVLVGLGVPECSTVPCSGVWEYCIPQKTVLFIWQVIPKHIFAPNGSSKAITCIWSSSVQRWRKTVNLWGKENCQMTNIRAYCIYYPSNIFRNTAVWKFEEYFGSWGIFCHVMRFEWWKW